MIQSEWAGNIRLYLPQGKQSAPEAAELTPEETPPGLNHNDVVDRCIIESRLRSLFIYI